MGSALSSVPVAKRRQLAATIGLFAALFVTMGLVATTGSAPASVRVFSAIAITVAVVLGLISWGILHSIRTEVAEQQVDAAIAESVQAHGGSMCDCGHDHDPTEMHVSNDSHEACAHDGSGAECAHDCTTCVLAAMRPSPHKSRAARLAE